MKCITLWQPWATAIADGFKTIETRTWSTNYRGPLGIHAGKGWAGNSPLLEDETVRKSLQERGKIIAVAILADVIEYTTEQLWRGDEDKHRCPFSFHCLGLFGWVLEDVRRIESFEARGSQGFWNSDQLDLRV